MDLKVITAKHFHCFEFYDINYVLSSSNHLESSYQYNEYSNLIDFY